MLYAYLAYCLSIIVHKNQPLGQINFKQIDFPPCIEEFGNDNVGDCQAAMTLRMADGAAIAATMQT